MHWALDSHVAGRSQAFPTAPPGINNPKIPAEFQKCLVQGKEDNPKGTQGLAQPDPTPAWLAPMAGSKVQRKNPEPKPLRQVQLPQTFSRIVIQSLQPTPHLNDICDNNTALL